MLCMLREQVQTLVHTQYLQTDSANSHFEICQRVWLLHWEQQPPWPPVI